MKGKSILVSSNCQTDTITEALQVLLSNYNVTQVPIPSDNNKNYLDSDLRNGVDYLVSSNPIFFESDLQKNYQKTKFIKFPTIDFAAFHPDIVYAVNHKNEFLRCLDADYHSALVLWGWKNNFDANQIINLFRSDIFYKIGYLGAWEPSVLKLQKNFTDCGFDFTTFWRSIKRADAFMHSINHPKVFVLCELAKQIAKTIDPCSIENHDPIDQLLTDQLSAIRWPVYPPIAKVFGIKGMYRWKIRKTKYNSLEEYVNGAIRSYDETKLEKNQICFHSNGYEQLDMNLKSILGVK